MTRFLHQLSAVCFYVLGASFFVAYALLRREVGGQWPAWWLQTADLPLALSAITYGGLSVYLSVWGNRGPSRLLAILIGVPLAGFFLLLVALNFSVLWR